MDTGISGTKASRPALDRLTADARARRFAMVVVVRVDRWARSVTDCMASLQLPEGYGVAWVATLQNLTTEKSDPMGKLMLTMMAAFAQLERDMTRERTLAGIARAKKEGTKSGKAFGRPR